ncbi:MAG: tetratricopeptide repeat protein [Nitrospinae bacterium]|nr:tetratricopeptide repeat protein [Nitrospinota bacterium]
MIWLENLFRKILGLFRKKPQEPPKPAAEEDIKTRIARYKEAVRLDPNDGSAQYNLGAAYIELRRYAEAIPPLKEAIRVNPDHPTAYYHLGKSLVETGRDEDATDALRFAMGKNPESLAIKKLLAEAHKNLCVWYGRVKRYEESMKHFNAAIQVVPDYGPAYLALGMNYTHLGHYQDAIDTFKKTLDMDPNLVVDVHYNYGIVYAKLGDHKKSIKHFKEAIEINPKSALPHLHLGTLYLKLERYEEAVERLRDAVILSPKVAAEGYYRLGVALMKLERYQEALKPLTDALGLTPNHPAVQDSYVEAALQTAQTLRQDKKYQEEIELLRAAAKVNPEKPDIHALLAEIYDILVEPANAMVHGSIAKQLYVENRDEAGLTRSMRYLVGVSKKYGYKIEDFAKVKIPRRKV